MQKLYNWVWREDGQTMAVRRRRRLHRVVE